MSKHYFGDASGVARRMKRLYFGVETPVPVYETESITVEETLTTANYDSFFDVETGSTSTTKWTFISGLETGIKLKSGSASYDNADITLTAKKRIYGVTITNAATSSYGNYCSLGVYLNETLVSSSTKWAAGTEEFWSGNLDAGDSIRLRCNMSLGSAMNYYIIVASAAVGATYTESVQTGTETKSVARRILGAYYSAEGVAQTWWEEETERVVYTGEYTVRDVTINGASYRLYTLTGDGELTLSAAAQYWMNGGGASGARGAYENGYCKGGLGGGGGYIDTGELTAGAYSVSIGQGGARMTSGSGHNAGTATTITGNGATHTAAGATGADGASGGGGAGWAYNGSMSPMGTSGGAGQGESTVPFALDALGRHSAGGAGGAGYAYVSGAKVAYGGDGGSDGASGSAGTTTAPGTTDKHATGGEVGGGDGGNHTGGAGADASGYGSGGGGGSMYYRSGTSLYGNGGAGYQGVVYLLLAA